MKTKIVHLSDVESNPYHGLVAEQYLGDVNVIKKAIRRNNAKDAEYLVWAVEHKIITQESLDTYRVEVARERELLDELHEMYRRDYERWHGGS